MRREPGTGFLCHKGGCCLWGCWQSQARWRLQDGVSRLSGSLWGGHITLILAAHPAGQDGHQDPLTCVASNQDGSLIMTGSVDCHAKLINSATGKVRLWGLGRGRSAGDPLSALSWAEGRARNAGVPSHAGPVCGHRQAAGGALALRVERGLGGPARLLAGSSLLFAPRS